MNLPCPQLYDFFYKIHIFFPSLIFLAFWVLYGMNPLAQLYCLKIENLQKIKYLHLVLGERRKSHKFSPHFVMQVTTFFLALSKEACGPKNTLENQPVIPRHQLCNYSISRCGTQQAKSRLPSNRTELNLRLLLKFLSEFLNPFAS